jgi:hypothetical protein
MAEVAKESGKKIKILFKVYTAKRASFYDARVMRKKASIEIIEDWKTSNEAFRYVLERSWYIKLDKNNTKKKEKKAKKKILPQISVLGYN